jgi:hypothetical protein
MFETEIDLAFLAGLKSSSKISNDLKRVIRKLWYFKNMRAKDIDHQDILDQM